MRDATHHLDSHAAAALMRRKTHVTVLPPQRADGLIWAAMLLMLLLGGGGLAFGLWWAKRPPAPPQLVEMRVGEVRLAAPSTYLGPRPADMAREVGMVRFRVSWPELQPPPPDEVADVHVTLGPDDPATDPAAQFATLARFLAPGAWSNPNGLVMRSFKPGSPFETEELFMSLPDGAEFFARCTSDIGATRIDEGCRAVLKHAGMDMMLRFPREALTDWRALSTGVRELVERFRLRD